MVLRPRHQGELSYIGQLCGAECVLLLSIALVLVSTLPWVETWFDGIDRAAIWHRRVAIVGVLLLVPHILLSQGSGSERSLGIIGALGLAGLVIWAVVPRWRSVLPRGFRPLVDRARHLPVIRQARSLLGGYERWRALHRLTGLFVGVGFVHGVVDGTPFSESAPLRWIYITIGAVGLLFYLYRELLARHVVALHDYQVDHVSFLGDGMMELVLAPLGSPMAFVPGQFAMLFLEGASGWKRHPFTIASAPSSRLLRFTVKALGDDTTAMHESVRTGMPAVIRGPFGRFTHAKGGEHQLWIAGGVGIAPFLSWLRSLEESPTRGRIDFFYSSRDGGAAFAGELRSMAERHQELRVHLVNSATDGRLTAARILEESNTDPRTLSAFLCGPKEMVHTLQAELRRSGVPARAVFREYFTWR